MGILGFDIQSDWWASPFAILFVLLPIALISILILRGIKKAARKEKKYNPAKGPRAKSLSFPEVKKP